MEGDSKVTDSREDNNDGIVRDDCIMIEDDSSVTVDGVVGDVDKVGDDREIKDVFAAGAGSEVKDEARLCGTIRDSIAA